MDSVTVALRTVRIEGWLTVLALVSILIVPAAALYVLSRFWSHGTRWKQTAVWTAGCTSVAFYILVAFVFAVCWGGEYGEPGKRRLAKAYGAPVIEALSRYREVNGAYPLVIADLVPAFLSATDLRAPEDAPLDSRFEYVRDTTGFTLNLEYHGPGMNSCRYTPREGWHCSGYF